MHILLVLLLFTFIISNFIYIYYLNIVNCINHTHHLPCFPVSSKWPSSVKTAYPVLHKSLISSFAIALSSALTLVYAS